MSTTSDLVAGLAFQHRPTSHWLRLVGHVAKRPVHCGFVFRDRDRLHAPGAWDGWHATNPEGLVPLRLTPDQAARGDWRVLWLPQLDTARLAGWAADRQGARYDVGGALLWWGPFTHRTRWTCSEACAEAAVDAGAPVGWLDAGRTPRLLERAVRAWRP